MERQLIAAGVVDFCGVDEAGRGPLAGPVVAAAVMFHDCDVLWQSRDSKVLTAAQRADLYERITTNLTAGVGEASAEEIDAVNIHQASLLAMARAVTALGIVPRMVLVDGRHRLPMSIPSYAIVDGDARVALIGAASIVAKVSRDRLMVDYDRLYPAYGFARHFGYPTPAHREALKKWGPCPIHRRTFRGVRELSSTAF